MIGIRQKGFTLLELLIVIAIIGLIATFAAFTLGNSRKRARDTKRVSDLGQIRKAMELGFNQGNGYPLESSPVVLGDASHKVLCGKGNTIALRSDKSSANCDADKIYIGLIPSDPLASSSYLYTGSASTYCIEAVLEVGTKEFKAGAIHADPESYKDGPCP